MHRADRPARRADVEESCGIFVSPLTDFQYQFPEPLGDKLSAYVGNLKRLSVWVNHDLSLTAFGGKQTYDFWQKVSETGRSPQGQQVLAGPINLTELIREDQPLAAST
jgi:hypothetical protein